MAALKGVLEIIMRRRGEHFCPGGRQPRAPGDAGPRVLLLAQIYLDAIQRGTKLPGSFCVKRKRIESRSVGGGDIAVANDV